MADELEDELRSEVLSDWDKTELWRKHVLMEAGYSRQSAARMARRPEIDLHRAVELVKSGCPPGVAERILAPFEP